MIMKPKVIHLIADMSLGGVTKNLEVFEQDILALKYESTIVEVTSEWKLAPKYDADIIITHFSPSWANLPYLYSLRKRNKYCKIVHMEHSYSPEWEAYSVTDTNRFRTMLRLSYTLFDKIICVSKTQSKWLRDIEITPSDKLHIINPWSEIESLFALPLPIINDNKPLVIGSYGRLVKEKGFEDLIQSFLKVDNQDIHLIIGGYGPDEEYLQKLSCNNPRIKFYGLVDNLHDFMQQCDVIAIPSYFETYGLVATEARAASRPILVSPVGALIEQIGNAGLTIDFRDHDNASITLSSLRQLPLNFMAMEARKSCSKMADNTIKTWDKYIAQLLCDDIISLKAA